MSISLPPGLPSAKEFDRDRGSLLMVNEMRELIRRLNQEQIKVQESLSLLGFALRSFNNLKQFLELIPLVASRVTDTDGGALILFKDNGKSLRMRLESLHCSEEVRNGLSLAQVRLAIELAIQKSVSAPAGLLDEMVSLYLGKDVHLFGTSILAQNTVSGRLYVFSRSPNYIWSEAYQKLIRLVADQTAVGIEKNSLTAELLKKESQDRELEIGAEIQRQLLPRSNPNVPGLDIASRCLTANRVGGDYYDFIPVSKSDRWGIVIGDVMGKGVPAGLIMTMTRGMLRAEVLNGHSPGKILEHLNEAMYDDLEKSHRFVTMFYSEYNATTRKLRFSNAAHAPVLLWRSQSGKMETLDTLGALIGLESESNYEESAVYLEPGDVVVYYTDGFTEAANKMGERFEEDNLRLAIQTACQQYVQTKNLPPNVPSDLGCSEGLAQFILDYIFDQVQKFVGGGRRNEDDMTLVILRVCP